MEQELLYWIIVKLVICAGKSDSDIGGGQSFQFNHGSGVSSGIFIVANSGYKMPAYKNGTNVSNEVPYVGHLDRVVFGTTVNGQGYLYDKDILQANTAVTPPSRPPQETYGALMNYRSADYKYNFFAITEGMTTEDWAALYPLLLTFLQSVGKHD